MEKLKTTMPFFHIGLIDEFVSVFVKIIRSSNVSTRVKVRVVEVGG